MTSEPTQKSSFSTGRNRSDSINTPRFAAQAVHRGHSSTAERHTWPAPELISSQNSADELGNNVPGSYPQEDMPWVSQMLKKHHDVDNPRHLGTMKVDLPLEEQPSGAREGVGSLPGPNAESGVAILPDERHPDRFQEDPEDSPLPSKEHPSGSRVGVGSLPGKNFEAGVATLPEERIDGRPFGQGHTGFEKTLGNERTHIDVDTPATRSKGQHAPKETIFSATQREMKRDPDFLSHRGAFFQHTHQANLPSAEGVRTFVQGAAGAMYLGAEGLLHGAQGAIQSFEERFKGQDPIQATKDVIQSLEARFGAEDALKHAKEQIQGLEGRIGAGTGDAVQGVKGVIRNLEARFAHNPGDAEIPPANVTSRNVSTPQDSSGEKESRHSTGIFDATGTDSRHSEVPPSSGSPVPPTPTSKEDSNQVSGVPSTLPETLQQEYLRSHDRELNEGSLDLEKHDTNIFAYDGDKSARASISGNNGAEEMLTGDDRDVPSIKGGDMTRGLEGVQYYTQAQGGILPGYPTPEGMAALIDGRLKDDQARNTAAVDNASVLADTNTTRSGRARLLRDDSAASAEAVRGACYSSEFHPSNSDSPDPSVEDRIIKERREIPVFEGGSIHPDGKYEAVFRPISDYPEELIASSALHQAHQHHDLHRPSRSSETKDLSGQFAHSRHGKHSSSNSGEEHARKEQVSRTNHLANEVDQGPAFLGQSGDTASGKYDATYHLADIPSVEIPSTDMPAVVIPSLATRSLDPDAERFRNEQLMKTDHPSELEGRPDFRGQSTVTASGKYEATYHPAGMPPRPFVADGKELRIEQLVRANHPTEIDERPNFLGQAGITAGSTDATAFGMSSAAGAGEYKSTFHPTKKGPDQVTVSYSHRQPPSTQEQGSAMRNNPIEIEERPILTGESETVEGRYEVVYAPMGVPLDAMHGMDIGRTTTVQQEETGLKKEMPAYLGKPLSRKQPVQEQHVPKQKTLN